jgi:hypothetical protein
MNNAALFLSLLKSHVLLTAIPPVNAGKFSCLEGHIDTPSGHIIQESVIKCAAGKKCVFQAVKYSNW